MTHVFLDPDGTEQTGLMLIVQAQTGVTYEQQCGGYATEQMAIEGFLLPVGGLPQAQKIYDWFWKIFHGHCYRRTEGSVWTPETISQLQGLVAEVRCWHSTPGGDSEPHFLQLDLGRIEECIEAWLPVLTPYGPAILTLHNSD